MKRLIPLAMLLAALAHFALAAGPQPAMTPEAAFGGLAKYDYGQDDAALHVIQLHIARFATDPARKAQVAGRLAAILQKPGTSEAAKGFILRELVVVGTDAQVPVLARMLDDAKSAELARYTLEAIPGEASLDALRGALGRLKPPALVGAINSLGIRRDAKSAGPLAALVGNTDPQIAAAAAEALGKIATPEAAAALAKAQVPDKARAALHNARLQCAERLAAAGEAAAATRIYESVWASKQPAAGRMAGLVGLAKVAPDRAAPLVLDTLASNDPLLAATAARLACRLPGLTAALVARLDKADAAGQVRLLGILAERGDRAAAPAALARLGAKDEAVRAAAVRAAARLAGAAVVDQLAALAATGSGDVRQAARSALATMIGDGVEPKLLAMAGKGNAAVRTEVFGVLAARRCAAAAPVLLEAASGPDEPLRTAALQALAVVAGPDSYPKLVELLVTAPTPGDAAAAQRAVLAAGARLSGPSEAARPVIAALGKAPAKAKLLLLESLGRFAGPEALAAVRGHLAEADPAVCDAAVRALAAWPDVAAADDLLKITEGSKSTRHRVLALRGYLRLVGQLEDARQRLAMLRRIRPIANSAASKRMLLGGLSQAPDAGALQVAAEFLEDAEVQPEATAAVLTIARALVRTDPPAVRAAMRRLMDTTKDKAVAEQAAALDEEAMKAPSPEAIQRALQHDAKRSDAQKAALQKRAPQGFHLVCYLDCGPDAADGPKGGPLLRVTAGGPYFWPDSAQVADVRFGTIAFDSRQVDFEAAGLNPKRSYRIGFTWWDFDHDTRAQSVWLSTGKGERATKALDKTPLPSGANKQAAEEKTVPVPRQLYADGTLRISFRNETQPNAVVSEIWLWESNAEK